MSDWIGITNPETVTKDELLSKLMEVINLQGFVIIASPQRMEVGEVMAGVSNMAGTEKVHQPFVVTRESSYKKWVKQNKEVVGSRNPYAKPMGWDWFYEVRTD